MIAADLLRLVGLVLVPVAGWVAGWPAAAALFLVFGAQWLMRWLAGGTALDWVGQPVLLAAGWFSATGAYHRVPGLDMAMHVATTAVVALLVGVVVRFGIRRRLDRQDPAQADHLLATTRQTIGRGIAWLMLASAATALGVLWEVGEWIGYTFINEEIGVGYHDTIGDLAANTVGALLGAWFGTRSPDTSPRTARRDTGTTERTPR